MDKSSERPLHQAAPETIVQRAARALPGGVTHDMRWRDPPGPYFTHAHGSRKWDQDGKAYVDFVSGHGALLLGSGHPKVDAAVADALSRGSHLGGNHEGEVEWAELVIELLPSSEMVRFTSSGTEASLLAMRLARAETGRSLIGKLPGHFHGWHDYGMVGLFPPLDLPSSPGIPKGVLRSVVVVPEDVDAIRARLARRDIAALILEATGASWGTLPLSREFLRHVQEICDDTGTVLILDEVISGFRVSPGGIQLVAGISPGLTVLGKVLAGGLPGGAVAGRGALMNRLAYRGIPDYDRFDHVYHPGTFNANPLSAAAGVATLREVRDRTPIQQADELASLLRRQLGDALSADGIRACVYGSASWFHVAPMLAAVPRSLTDLYAVPHALVRAIDRCLLDEGVDTVRLGGFVSAAHTVEDIELTVQAYVRAITLGVRKWNDA